jgi:hypothetical protein
MDRIDQLKEMVLRGTLPFKTFLLEYPELQKQHEEDAVEVLEHYQVTFNKKFIPFQVQQALPDILYALIIIGVDKDSLKNAHISAKKNYTGEWAKFCATRYIYRENHIRVLLDRFDPGENNEIEELEAKF